MPSAFVRTATIALFAAALAFAPVRAEQMVIITTITTVWSAEEDGEVDAADVEQGWPDEEPQALLADETLSLEGDAVSERSAVRRYAASTPSLALTAPRAKARFGPFTVIDGVTARMAGDVDSITPRQFAAMMAAFPGLQRLEMLDCPGSLDEEANLTLARAIRRAGLETHVPSGGSVRSGAVELWLAGAKRSAAPDAEFGVHSWADEYGREARDYPADDPVHAEYLSLYREMGMDPARARAFYALTNSTPFDEVRYLTRADMARFALLN